jgi:hypothetical protein
MGLLAGFGTGMRIALHEMFFTCFEKVDLIYGEATRKILAVL